MLEYGFLREMDAGRSAGAIRTLIAWGAALLCVAGVSLSAHATVRLNEVVASNGSTAADEDGDYSDWIEILNTGAAPVSLEGYGLSDNPSSPFKWVFPDVTIGPGEYLIVWASNKDRATPGAPLHTSYAVSADGEDVLLTAPGGALVDEVPVPALPRDVSYGRKPDGTGDWRFFGEPTPGAPNTTEGYVEYLAPVAFSHPAGFYTSGFNLALSHPDPGAAIVYTTDGSEPDAANLAGTTYQYKIIYPRNPGDPFGDLHEGEYRSETYTGPVAVDDRSSEPNRQTHISTTYNTAPNTHPAGPVSKGTVVRARAFKDGALPSPIETHTYFIYPEGRDRYSLPVISLSMNEDGLFDYDDGIYVPGRVFDNWRAANPHAEVRTPGNFSRRGEQWEYRAHVEFFEPGEVAPVLSHGIGYRIHGGYSRTHAKKSLRLYARGGYGESYFEHAVFPDLPDTSYKRLLLRNEGNFDLLRDAAAHRIVEGLGFDTQAYRPAVVFINGEYWGLHEIRERYDKHYLARVYGVDPETIDYLELEQDVVEGDRQHYRQTLNYIRDNGLRNPTDYEYIKTRIDVDNFMNYHIAQIFLRNYDWPGSNIEFWRLRTDAYRPDAPYGQDGRWRWLAFDFDNTLAGSPAANWLVHATAPAGPSHPNPPWSTFLLRSFLENDTFHAAFINRFGDLLNTAFLPERTTAIIETLRAELLPERPEDIERWGNPATLSAWTQFVDDMVSFVDRRPAHQRQHIVSFFDLDGTAEVTLAVSGAEHGHVRVNTVEIQPGTAGVGDPAYPWSGVYFLGVPIEVEAVAAPGYAFSHWEGLPDGTPAQATVELTGDVALTAHFVAVEALLPIHYWHFNDLPNGALCPVAADYTVPGGAVIAYPGTGDGYMDSVSDGTDINARLAAAPGDGLRVRNPSDTRELVFEMPTTGFERITFSYATVRTNAGAQTQTLWYRIEAEGPWLPLGDPVTVTEDYALVTRDLSAVAEADDNAAFAVRILFEGPEAAGGSGNDRFDNAALDGFPLAGLNLPPTPTDAAELAQAIEGGAPVQIDMDALFDDPEDDPLTFDVSVNKPANATVSAEGSVLTVTPLLRGDAVIEVTADDGTNAPIATTFRVLIYPEAAALRHTGFTFSEWDPNHPENVYPAHMLFLQSDVDDPGADTPLLYPYYIAHDDYHANDADKIGFPYQLTGRTRLNGLGDDGIAFINTGRGRDLGGALLAVDTRELQVVHASWLAGTLLPNSRVYGIRLQYRTSLEAPFADVLVDGQPVVYVRDAEGHTQTFGPVPLPEDALGQPYVQLMWRYHHISGTSGARAQLRLDEVAAEAEAEQGPVGAIQVVIGPGPAAGAGAMWSIDGGATWHDSGETVTAPAGEYTLIFSDVPGRHAPEPRTVTVGAGELTVLSAAYSPLLSAANLLALALTATALLAAVGALRRRATR